MEPKLWFIIVFLVVLKIPIVYLCYVVWWAVKDPPVPGEGYGEAAGDSGLGGPGPDAGSWWKRRMPPRSLRRGPHGSPARRPALTRARSRTPL
jgi:hypothetical protein